MDEELIARTVRRVLELDGPGPVGMTLRLAEALARCIE